MRPSGLRRNPGEAVLNIGVAELVEWQSRPTSEKLQEVNKPLGFVLTAQYVRGKITERAHHLRVICPERNNLAHFVR